MTTNPPSKQQLRHECSRRGCWTSACMCNMCHDIKTRQEQHLQLSQHLLHFRHCPCAVDELPHLHFGQAADKAHVCAGEAGESSIATAQQTCICIQHHLSSLAGRATHNSMMLSCRLSNPLQCTIFVRSGQVQSQLASKCIRLQDVLCRKVLAHWLHKKSPLGVPTGSW